MTTPMLTKSQSNLIMDALEIEREEAKAAGTIGYMARALTLATIPHRDPKELYFERSNGHFTIRITDTTGQGLPYGTYPRLLLAWLTTEAVLTKSRELELGGSLSEFMRKLGLGTDGLTIRRLKEQTAKLFGSSIMCTHADEERMQGYGLNIASRFDIWWHPLSHSQSSIKTSTVTLSQDFFESITERPVPIDLRALEALKRSPMALDIYTWLTYRMSYLERQTAISWEQLQMQLGAGYSVGEDGRKNFQRAFTKHLKSVLTVYPEAKVDSARGRLILKPSPPHIAKK